VLSVIALAFGCTEPADLPVDSDATNDDSADRAPDSDSGDDPAGVLVTVSLEVDVGWVIVVGDEEDEWDYITPSEFPAGSVLVDRVEPGTWYLLAASPERDRCEVTTTMEFQAGNDWLWTVSQFSNDYDFEADFFACGGG